jgi:hypothetical protein
MSSQKRQKRRKENNLHALEPLFLGVQEALMHDLADSHMKRLYCKKERGEELQPINDGAPPYVFKKIRQLVDFSKRILWSTDKSFETLSDESLNGFAESQRGFNCPEPMSKRATLVIQEARKICHSICGEFDHDEWMDSCSFGKRAAVGLPRSKSYLDVRFDRISGSEQQIGWFKHALSRDVHLFRAVRKRLRSFKTVTCIIAQAVPKSWKVARIVAPDTILGGFLSRGLGEMLRRRLEKNTHIDLALQQERHKRWARKASKTGRSSTIDMSKASDSFVRRHLELLLHESWMDPLDCARTSLCEVNGKVIELRSFMLMGSGHTFPLQTILFYSLAKSVCSLLKSEGLVSVYGDDIIVPTKCATKFIVIMEELGFTINSAKSFYDEPDCDRPSHTFFRESCGGDYKGGIDVRPYMPECDLQEISKVPRNEYVAWCHKMTNGLLTRWDSSEIEITLRYLLHEINNKKCDVHFVPHWETDHAGITHELPERITFGLTCKFVTYKRSMPVYTRLSFSQEKRERNVDERPYVWYSYWLKRQQHDLQAPLSFTLDKQLQNERILREHKDYDAAIALAGEPDKRKCGRYSWKITEQKGK